MDRSLFVYTPSYLTMVQERQTKRTQQCILALGLFATTAVATYQWSSGVTQMTITTPSRPIALPVQAISKAPVVPSSQLVRVADRQAQGSIAELQVGGPTAVLGDEETFSFVRRLKVGSAFLLLATVCIETLRSFAAKGQPQRQPMAMAGHSGLRAGTALRATEGDDEIVDVLQKEIDEKQRKIAELRAQEKFMKLGTGSNQCPNCGYVYQSTKGDPEYPIAPGTQFVDLPGDWACPVCGSPKDKFVSDGVEVAGFAVNQGYGLGTNSMTGEQKSLVIYGLLLLFFFLFLAGYGLN